MEKQETAVQPTKQAIPVMLIAQPMGQDQVTFASILGTLRRRKWLVVVISAMTTGIGLSVALLTPPVYRSEIFLLPPKLSDISGLWEVDGATPAGVYGKFMTSMKSRSVRNAFFLSNGMLNELAPEAKTAAEKRNAFSAFDKMLVVESTKTTLEGTNPDLIARWLNDFVQSAAQTAKDEVIADVTVAIQSEKNKARQACRGKAQDRSDSPHRSHHAT